MGENWQHIRDELEALQNSEGGDGEAWSEVHGHDRNLTHGTGTWREYALLGLNQVTEERAKRLCPITHGLLARVEPIRSHADLRPKQETAMFSRLTPGTHLKAHCGPTNTHLTCHLGLKVPTGCEIRCGTERRSWEEGKCIIFDDSFEH